MLQHETLVEMRDPIDQSGTLHVYTSQAVKLNLEMRIEGIAGHAMRMSYNQCEVD
jgi:hypothetical protein